MLGVWMRVRHWQSILAHLSSTVIYTMIPFLQVIRFGVGHLVTKAQKRA